MSDRAIVLDANILIRAMLGKRVSELIAARTKAGLTQGHVAQPHAWARPAAIGRTQTAARDRRAALMRLLRETSPPKWSITTDGRSGNLATSSSFPLMHST